MTYEDKESALDAIQAMDGALFGRRHIRGKLFMFFIVDPCWQNRVVLTWDKVNRAKLPERNQYGFGNIPWTDEGMKELLQCAWQLET